MAVSNYHGASIWDSRSFQKLSSTDGRYPNIKFGYDSSYLVLYSYFGSYINRLEVRTADEQMHIVYSTLLDFKLTSLTCHPQRDEIAYAGENENIYIWHPKQESFKILDSGDFSAGDLKLNLTKPHRKEQADAGQRTEKAWDLIGWQHL